MRPALNKTQFAIGGCVVKKMIDHITNPITLAIVIAGLAVVLPLSAVNARFSPSAQAANRYSDESAHLQDLLQEAVADTRYEARWEERPAKGMLPSAYHAPNPAQQYDAYFTPNGLSLTEQETAPNDAMPKWRVGMRLIGFGYGEDLLNVGTAAIETHGARIEFRRTWLPITEWYVNKAAGLEQGFTIETAPGPRSDGERLQLALELTGDLSAELAKGGQTITFKLADEEPALSYSDLYAYDAQRRELPSRMRLSKGHVILEVDDENAVYPVTIDPTFTVQDGLLHTFDASDPEFFGSSVAIHGDTLVVGAPNKDDGADTNQGAAYVFKYSSNGWSHEATLWASDGAANDYFGLSVAISGNTVVVGARYADENFMGDQGAAYVFVRSGGIWTEEQKITDGDGMPQDRFGTSVALSVDTLVVGVDPVVRQGAAYVFVRSGGVWRPQQKLTNGAKTPYDSFGTTVDVDLNTVVVGAPHDTIGANSQQGSAYVFVRNETVWSQQAKLIAGDGAASDQFGCSVAVSGNSVVVGAHLDTVGTTSRQGSAYVFVRNLSSWSQNAKLTANDGMANDYFGYSVAIHGYTIVVGAYFDDEGPNAQQGSAYVFVRTGQVWSQQQKLVAWRGRAFDRFGTSVATSAGTIVVGAPLRDYVYQHLSCLLWCWFPDQGTAYVFRQ